MNKQTKVTLAKIREDDEAVRALKAVFSPLPKTTTEETKGFMLKGIVLSKRNLTKNIDAALVDQAQNCIEYDVLASELDKEFKSDQLTVGDPDDET